MIKGLANLITLLRFFFACILNVYILNNQGKVLVPIIISCIIFLTDFLDGRIARILGNTTSFGAVFDASVDLFYIAASYGTLIYLQTAPLWFLTVIIFNFTEFAITSVLLNKHSNGEAIFVFDFIGRIGATLFYITPLLIYLSYQLSSSVYHFSSGVFIYGVTTITFISTIYRILRCVTVVKLPYQRQESKNYD